MPVSDAPQRRQIVLHASAVRVNSKAILFCGPSGASKSTLAAALAQRGYPFITDDFCAVTVTKDGTPMVHPDGRQLKLWAQAIEKLELKGKSGARVRSRLEKFYVDPGETHAEALPLGTLYALREARPPLTPGIAPANAVDAAAMLRRLAYRPRLINRMGQRVDYFHAATTIANKAGIFLSDQSARLRGHAQRRRRSGTALAQHRANGASGVSGSAHSPAKRPNMAPRSLRRRLVKFAQVGHRRRAVLIEAVAWLLVARLSLIFVSFPRLARRLGTLVAPTDPRASRKIGR